MVPMSKSTIDNAASSQKFRVLEDTDTNIRS
jgi:hypothetical protein